MYTEHSLLKGGKLMGTESRLSRNERSVMGKHSFSLFSAMLAAVLSVILWKLSVGQKKEHHDLPEQMLQYQIYIQSFTLATC